MLRMNSEERAIKAVNRVEVKSRKGFPNGSVGIENWKKVVALAFPLSDFRLFLQK
jgi:hypothetical protein